MSRKPRMETARATTSKGTPMYIPAAFAETGLTQLHDFIEQNSFGLLVSQVDGLPFATHLPFLLERSAGPHGTLVGHVARANPQWRAAGGQTGTTPLFTLTDESRSSRMRLPFLRS